MGGWLGGQVSWTADVDTEGGEIMSDLERFVKTVMVVLTSQSRILVAS